MEWTAACTPCTKATRLRLLWQADHTEQRNHLSGLWSSKATTTSLSTYTTTKTGPPIMHQRPVVNRVYLDAVQRHLAKWRGCTDCPLHQSCRQKVFFRGDVPCDVLIIGNSPLQNDEDVGLPMKGDNGEVIDEIIDDTIAKFKVSQRTFNPLVRKEESPTTRTLKTCITNAVLCRGDEAPDRENLRACSKRLAEFIGIAKPQLLIAAGKQAGSAIIQLLAHLPEYPRSLEIKAPGYVTRLGGDDRETEMARIKLSINKALSNVFGDGTLVQEGQES